MKAMSDMYLFEDSINEFKEATGAQVEGKEKSERVVARGANKGRKRLLFSVGTEFEGGKYENIAMIMNEPPREFKVGNKEHEFIKVGEVRFLLWNGDMELFHIEFEYHGNGSSCSFLVVRTMFSGKSGFDNTRKTVATFEARSKTDEVAEQFEKAEMFIANKIKGGDDNVM